jgi:hypothetical protein
MELPQLTNAVESWEYVPATNGAIRTDWPSSTEETKQLDNTLKVPFNEWEEERAYQGVINYRDEDIEEENMSDQRRIVQVFIVDTDGDVPVENALIYEGERKFTNLTNQELFYEIEIKSLLENHNEFRKTLLDKEATKATGKDIYLEEIRIRDLSMVVVEVAKF